MMASGRPGVFRRQRLFSSVWETTSVMVLLLSFLVASNQVFSRHCSSEYGGSTSV